MSTNRAERRRRLWLTLAIVGALLIVAVGVWAFWLATEPAEEPSTPSTPRPSATEQVPTPEESDAAPGALSIDNFVVHSPTVECPNETATVPLIFSWRSQGAEAAWVGVGTSDAKAQPLAEVETTVDGFTELTFACALPSQVYTLTIEGADEATVSSTVVVNRTLPIVPLG